MWLKLVFNVAASVNQSINQPRWLIAQLKSPGLPSSEVVIIIANSILTP
jgi:hypothetical protein